MTPERRSQLRQAYLDANYWVEGPYGRFAIRIGEVCHPIVKMLDRPAADWAFITACNPCSHLLTDADNAVRMNHLVADLTIAGYRFFPGEGAARDGAWKAEPSVLIVGIDETAALDLARRYGQLAIVCGRGSESARLVWTDSDTTTSHESPRGTSP
jgi:Protein of unknown function (DUF3293)